MCNFLALVNLSFIPQYNIQQFLMLLLFTFTDLYIIPKIRLEQTVTLVSFLIVQYTSLLYCASLVSSWIVVFQAGVIRENTGYKWFCWNNSWKLRFCFVILLVWQIISLVPLTTTIVDLEISKIWNVILLKHYTGILLKDFLWDFFNKLRCISNKKWICYRNIQARSFKLHRRKEMLAILIFVGKLSGNARALL